MRRRCFADETPAGYDISGSTWQALYECKDGRFIPLQFSTRMVRRGLWQPRVQEAYNVVGFEVDPRYAVQFLIDGQFPIPDEFQELINTQVDEPIEKTTMRPIADWKGRFPTENAKTPAHEARVVEILPQLRDRGIAAIHELQDWLNLPTGSRCTLALLQFVFKLTERYRVDPKHWSGPANAIPPKSVGLLELNWPDGVDEVKNRVLPELLDTLEPVGAVLLSTRLLGVEPRPNDEEVGIAEQFILDRLDRIVTLLSAIRQAVHDLETGKVSLVPRSVPEHKASNVRSILQLRSELASSGRAITVFICRLSINLWERLAAR